MKLGIIFIPLATIATATVGSLLTSASINSGWYGDLSKPAWTPGGAVIGLVWTTIFILTTIAALLWYNASPSRTYPTILALFVANAVLNAGWSYLFFRAHLLGPAIWESALLGLSVLALIYQLWPISKPAAYLLIPYALWVTFATYLTYAVWSLNR